MLTTRRTSRGFSLIEFKDMYDQPCSLQKSSIATEDCIWLGVHDQIDLNTKQVIGPAQRMHLTQEQVKELIPLLQKFVDTGELE